jgi:hypothetical protein
LGDLSTRDIFHEGISGKVFVQGEKVFIIVGVARNLLVTDGDGTQFVEDNAILAQSLGLVTTVRTKLSSGATRARGTLHGHVIDGQRFKRQPHIGSAARLIVFNGCSAITGPPNFTVEKAFIEEDEESGEQGGEWSPLEFKVLEMVDWKIT